MTAEIKLLTPTPQSNPLLGSHLALQALAGPSREAEQQMGRLGCCTDRRGGGAVVAAAAVAASLRLCMTDTERTAASAGARRWSTSWRRHRRRSPSARMPSSASFPLHRLLCALETHMPARRCLARRCLQLAHSTLSGSCHRRLRWPAACRAAAATTLDRLGQAIAVQPVEPHPATLLTTTKAHVQWLRSLAPSHTTLLCGHRGRRQTRLQQRGRTLPCASWRRLWRLRQPPLTWPSSKPPGCWPGHGWVM